MPLHSAAQGCSFYKETEKKKKPAIRFFEQHSTKGLEFFF